MIVSGHLESLHLFEDLSDPEIFAVHHPECGHVDEIVFERFQIERFNILKLIAVKIE